MTLFQSKIASGHNNPGGLTLFTDLNTSGLYLPSPVAIGSYSRGLGIIRGDYSLSFEGAKTCALGFKYLFPELLTYLNTTYCSGMNFGLVTLSLALITPESYSNYNATLYIPQEAELKSSWDPDAGWYNEVTLPVMDLVAL